MNHSVLCVFQKNFGCEEWMREGGVSRFSVETFGLTVPRNFVGQPFSVSLLSGAEKVWIREGVGSIKIFCRKFSFSEGRKIS